MATPRNFFKQNSFASHRSTSKSQKMKRSFLLFLSLTLIFSQNLIRCSPTATTETIQTTNEVVIQTEKQEENDLKTVIIKISELAKEITNLIGNNLFLFSGIMCIKIFSFKKTRKFQKMKQESLAEIGE